ncbi:MAG: SipW-dependent-type signal peptide-containing protein [Butyricimonas virosa]
MSDTVASFTDTETFTPSLHCHCRKTRNQTFHSIHSVLQ